MQRDGGTVIRDRYEREVGTSNLRQALRLTGCAVLAIPAGACGSVEGSVASMDSGADAVMAVDSQSDRVPSQPEGGDGGDSNGNGDGSDGASPLCIPATMTDGGACALPPYTSLVFTVTLWIQDATAPGGGSRTTLHVGESADVAGHTYRNASVGLFGGGPSRSVYGDVLLDVDGHANGLQFHQEGCASDLGNGSWDLPAALTRSSSVCPGCAPQSIARHYSIVRAVGPDDAGICPGQPSCVTFIFTADEPPRSCGFGVDLLGFVLTGS